MIYIVTALQIEASPIVEYFRLKRDMSINEYQVYKNSEIMLITGGVGKIKSAMAAVYLLAGNRSSKRDILLNIGFCGAASKKYPLGSLLIINKITDMDTGRDYYPDVFTGRDLPHEALYCCSKPMGRNALKDNEDCFCDMESSGIMEAARKFIYTHNVAVLKIISDYLTPDGLNKKQLQAYIQNQMPCVEQIINELKQLSDGSCNIRLDEEEKLIDIISDGLRLTKSMKQILFNEVKRIKLKGHEPIRILQAYKTESINTKAEGKRTLERIIEELKQTNI